MTIEPERRFCPRCGTAMVPGMPFCPSCGLNTTEIGRPATVAEDAGAEPGNEPVDALGRPLGAGPSEAPPVASSTATAPAPAPTPAGRFSTAALRRLSDPGSRGSAIVIGALIVAAGLVVFGLLMRPQPGAGPAAGSPGGPSGTTGPGAATPPPPTLIVDLSIQSPTDGQVVAIKDVTVIGLAPPGLEITRDVSFGFDQHATADGTGHWAMSVGLDEGENNLVFRLGDDRGTEKRLRVTFTPQGG